MNVFTGISPVNGQRMGGISLETGDMFSWDQLFVSFSLYNHFGELEK